MTVSVMANPRVRAARERDEAVADHLALGPCTAEGLARELGTNADCVRHSFKKLRRAGLPVVSVGIDEHVPRKRGRGSQPRLYRIVHPRGRVCAEPGCTTILRTTNPSDLCELHGGGVFVAEPLPELRKLRRKRRCPGFGRGPHMTTDFGDTRSYCRPCYRDYRREYERAKREERARAI